jgi:hypothetical protein
MLNPARVDAAIDLAYGGLILVAIALIATVEFGIGIAFAVGVFSAYILHVVWKMARFDPDWMTSVVEDAVDDAVDDAMGDSVEQVVEDSMERTVNGSVEQVVDERVATQVGETIGDQLDSVQARVEAVDDRLDDAAVPDQATEATETSETR